MHDYFSFSVEKSIFEHVILIRSMDKQIYSSLLKNIWNTKEKRFTTGSKKVFYLVESYFPGLKILFRVLKIYFKALKIYYQGWIISFPLGPHIFSPHSL